MGKHVKMKSTTGPRHRAGRGQAVSVTGLPIGEPSTPRYRRATTAEIALLSDGVPWWRTSRDEVTA
jgi:hypothetical protein